MPALTRNSVSVDDNDDDDDDDDDDSLIHSKVDLLAT